MTSKLMNFGSIAVVSLLVGLGIACSFFDAAPSECVKAAEDAGLPDRVVDQLREPDGLSAIERAALQRLLVKSGIDDVCETSQEQSGSSDPVTDGLNPIAKIGTFDNEGLSRSSETEKDDVSGIGVPSVLENDQVFDKKGQWYSAATDGPQTLAVRPTGTPPPSTTATARPVHTPQPPSTTTDNNFASQRTRVALTFVAQRTLVPTLVNQEKRHLQWELLTATGTAQQKQYGLAGFRSVNDGEGQQYSCAIYLDGAQVPRVNLYFSKDLTYQVVTNQLGEHQGAVNAITTVADTAVPVEWRTWVSRVDRIRLRDADAARLVHFINEWNTNEYVLDLKDNPELSATYDVSNLIAAINANKMTCFQSQ